MCRKIGRHGEILMNGLQEELPINRLRCISIKSLAQKTMMLPVITLYFPILSYDVHMPLIRDELNP